jgi:hypothetical protein
MTLLVRPGYEWWDPSLISTALWLDAADSSTVTTVSGGVSQWNDKSGNARHFSQSTTANRPTVNATAINGKPAIVFDGTNDSLAAASPVVPTTHSLFLLFVPTIENAPGTLLGQWAAAQAGRFVLTANQDDAGAAATGRLNAFNGSATNGNGTGGLADDIDISAAATLIESISTTGAESWKLLKNGTEWDSATITSVYQGVNTAIGTTSASGNSNYFDGQVAEIVMTGSVLSITDRQKVEGYLAHKWGIAASLPSTHPYKTNAPAP